MFKKKYKKVIIIALGDSLTEGFQTVQDDYSHYFMTPYTTFLIEMVDYYLKEKQCIREIDIINKGVCGDCTSNMLERFEADVLSYHPHYVIILGGANDIGFGMTSEKIINNLRLMYNLAESESIKPITCTIPSILGFDDLIVPRLTLNKLIEREAYERNMGFINLFIETSDPKTNRLLQKYSNDGLHLNTEGYKKISEVIFHKFLKKILNSNLCV